MPVETLSIYLLKESVAAAGDALKEGLDLREHNVEAGETTAKLFVQVGAPALPGFARFLGDAMDPPLNERGRSFSALLVLEAGDRWFAVAFGHAFHLLEPDAYERDFGLFVALNGVDPDRLRGAEARTFNDSALHTLRQLSRLSALESLEIDTERDLVVSLSGQLIDPDLGKHVDGRDAVRLRADIEPADLQAKCRELLEVSRRTTYRRNFEFFDSIRRVRNSTEIARLNSKVFNALGQQRYADFDLFPPEIVSAEIVAWRVAPSPGNLTTVIEPDNRLLRHLGGVRRPDYVEHWLHRHRLRGVDSGANVVRQWSFFECLHWEFVENNSTYVLDRGRWYCVEADLAADVDAFARGVRSSGHAWVPASPGEREDAYLVRAAPQMGLALLDKRLIRLPGQSRIEACDLFSADRDFVHVKKRKGGSGPLSHLFAQAMVSAEGFAAEIEFRRLFRRELERAMAGFGVHSPDQVDTRDYTIVLALITTPGAPPTVVERLPFFSKLMLRLTVRRLKSMGYSVHVDQIPTRATAPTVLPPAQARRPRRRPAPRVIQPART